MAIFNGQGFLVQSIHHKWPRQSSLLDNDTIDAFGSHISSEFGFSDGLIRIREFRFPHEPFAVYRMPEYYQLFLDDPPNPQFDHEARESLPRLVDEWRRSKQFVLNAVTTSGWIKMGW